MAALQILRSTFIAPVADRHFPNQLRRPTPGPGAGTSAKARLHSSQGFHFLVAPKQVN